ncbi:unnamed protein product, partial [Scytosiphon promiscuus]
RRRAVFVGVYVSSGGAGSAGVLRVPRVFQPERSLTVAYAHVHRRTTPDGKGSIGRTPQGLGGQERSQPAGRLMVAMHFGGKLRFRSCLSWALEMIIVGVFLCAVCDSHCLFHFPVFNDGLSWCRGIGMCVAL